MNQLHTKAIVLSRTEYGEADRIVTFLTPDSGKIRLMAKGVRRMKSKLAGGIELFSISDLTYIKGRGDIGTLISSRLEVHYDQIVKDINRTMLGYELTKQLNRATEDQPEPEYYDLLQQAFISLNNDSISPDLTQVWFSAQLLRLSGHGLNLRTEPDGTKLSAEQSYEFSYDDSAFMSREGGPFGADAIKFLRLLFNGNEPEILSKLQDIELIVQQCLALVTNATRIHIRT